LARVSASSAVSPSAVTARVRAGPCRVARRSLGEGGAERRAWHPGPRGDVAGGLDLPDQGRVDQAATALRRRQAGFHRAAQQLGGGNALARVVVQRAQLAARFEAGQRPVELGDEPSRPRCRLRSRGHPEPGLPDQQADVTAHRIEADVVLAHGPLRRSP
jgi:hypothetical protein